MIKETIEELPEREQNCENTNDFSEQEMRENAQRLQDATQPNSYVKLQNMKKTLESDYEFNCREDESSP